MVEKTKKSVHIAQKRGERGSSKTVLDFSVTPWERGGGKERRKIFELERRLPGGMTIKTKQTSLHKLNEITCGKVLEGRDIRKKKYKGPEIGGGKKTGKHRMRKGALYYGKQPTSGSDHQQTLGERLQERGPVRKRSKCVCAKKYWGGWGETK